MDKLLCKTDCCGRGATDKALLAIRVVAGLVFLMHGYGKLTGNPSIEMFSGMLAGMGIPMSMFFAWLVALLEFLGGIALILGVFVRPFGALLAINMLVALTMAKKLKFPAGDIDLALLGISVALAMAGAGRLSVAGLMLKDKMLPGGEMKSGGSSGQESAS